MKHRNRHSAVLFLSLMLVVSLLAGISPASYAAPLQKSMLEAGNAPTISDKASGAAVGEAVQAGEEVSLKDRLMKDEVQTKNGPGQTAERVSPSNTTGPKNTTGPSSLTGPKNTTGPSNTSGPKNTSGPSSSNGPKNTSGPSSSNGPKNTSGPSNSNGPKNTTGPSNSNGPKNTTGPSSSTGPKNTSGPSNTSGPKNTNGPSTTSGSGNTARPGTKGLSIEAIRQANDPDALMAKYGGYGFNQTVYADFFEDSDYSWYAGDGYIYCEIPEQVYDWDSYDWDSFDWSSFDWDLIEDWDDWADFGSDEWDGYDDWDGFDGYGYEPEIGILITDKNVYQLDRYDDGEENFAITWYAYPEDGSDASNLEEYPLRLLFDSPMFEIKKVRNENGLLAVTMTESPFAFEDDAFFGGRSGGDDAWSFDDGWVNGNYQWVYYLDPNTLEVQFYEADELLPNGEPVILYSRTVFYDKPDSDTFAEMLTRASAYELEKYQNPRTVTVIYNPGTDLEETVSRIAEKGDVLSTYFMEGYTLYEDADRKVPFFGSDGTQDLTLYAFRDDDINYYSYWDNNDAYWDDAWDYTWDDAWDYGNEWFVPEESAVLPAEENADFGCGCGCGCSGCFCGDCACGDGDEADFEGSFGDDYIVYDELQAEADAEAIKEDGTAHYHVLIIEPNEDEPGVVVLSPYSVDEPQEATIVPVDDAEEVLDYAEISDRVYEANKLDAIFRNHDSVQYCMTFDQDKNPERFDFVYETPDMAYRETRDAAFYATNDSFYQIWLDDDASDLFYTFDFVNSYDPIRNAGYEIVPATQLEWWNPENETPVDCWLEDGVIYLESVFNVEFSKAFIDSWVKEAYEGQTVSAMLIVNAETYEIIGLVYTVTDQNGEVAGSPLIYSVDYDAPEPRACRNLRAGAERCAELTAELTIVMNPGTEMEVTESMTVPIGSSVIYVTDSEMTLYDDAECTVPASRWDKLSDMTWYLSSAEAM